MPSIDSAGNYITYGNSNEYLNWVHYHGMITGFELCSHSNV